VRDPRCLGALSQTDVSRLAACCAVAQAAIAMRLAEDARALDEEQQTKDDRLLTAEEASAMLRVDPKWLYRRAARLPFARRLTPGRALRFSEQGLRSWLAKRHKT
jgi:hypothetical protein